MQAKSRGIVISDCQALSDIDDLYKALLQQKDMLAAFTEAAIPKLDTWVLARPADMHRQPAAAKQPASDPAVTCNTSSPLMAQPGSSAFASTAAASATLSQTDDEANAGNSVSCIGSVQLEGTSAAESNLGAHDAKQNALVSLYSCT